MASGTISLGTSGYLTGQIVWKSSSNGSTKNSSTVSASLQIKRTNEYTTTGTWSGNLNIGGTVKEFSEHKAIGDSWVTIIEFEIEKAHSASGAGTCYIYGKVNAPSGTSLAGKSVSGSQTVTLDTIPRKATITSAPSFYDTSSPTIKYTNPAGNAVDILEAGIFTTDGTALIAYKTISKTGTSYTFTFTNNDKIALQKACTTANSMSVRFYIHTQINKTDYYHYVLKTLTIADGSVTLSPTVEDSNSNTLSLTGDKNKLIKYYSNATFNNGETARKYATVSSRKVVSGSKSATTASGTLSSVDNGTFTFTAKDSRNNTVTQTVTKTLINYVKLTCGLTATATLEANNTTTVGFTVIGNYFNNSFGKVANTLTIEYRYKTGNSSYGNWNSLTVTPSGNKYSVSGSITGLDYTQSYTIQARAQDELWKAYGNYKASAEKTVKSTPIFDWGENDFNFNVPLKLAQNQYYYNTESDNKAYGLDVNNSDIIGINSLAFHDAVNNNGEGLLFPSSTSGYYHRLFIDASGNLYVEQNVQPGVTDGTYYSIALTKTTKPTTQA